MGFVLSSMLKTREEEQQQQNSKIMVISR